MQGAGRKPTKDEDIETLHAPVWVWLLGEFARVEVHRRDAAHARAGMLRLGNGVDELRGLADVFRGADATLLRVHYNLDRRRAPRLNGGHLDAGPAKPVIGQEETPRRQVLRAAHEARGQQA